MSIKQRVLKLEGKQPQDLDVFIRHPQGKIQHKDSAITEEEFEQMKRASEAKGNDVLVINIETV